ncbi:hypothetical protein GCM10020367_21940 [Streptomyces sannanensis]|uniref:Lipoprotein n=1 Tax=Streptomyces sannanensis TaxID=285536 RepID=A0ABP6SA39_9ACTN
MGASRRTLAALGIAAAAVVGVAACEPVGGLNTAAVAVTTDQMGTRALERAGVDVRWLSCTASTENGGGSGGTSPTPSGARRVSVDCRGKTGGGKDITLTGEVTEERAGRCVRGDLVAKVDGRTVFQARVLGDCSAPPVTPTTGPTPPPAGPGRPTVTVTVTVTETFHGK